METPDQTGSRPPCKRKVLVVDDNVDAADSLAMLLEFMGYETFVAYDGLQGVEIAQDWRPDLIMLDINMPVMDGYQAARQLRNSKQMERTVLVALTALATPTARSNSKAAGFDVHLVKPVLPSTLTQVVDKEIARKADMKSLFYSKT